MSKKAIIGAACVFFSVLHSNLHAANFSYTGVFSADNDVRLFDFSLDTVSTVTLRTYGYGGGVQANGNIVPAGGFDPVLTLFDSTGKTIGLDISNENNANVTPPRKADTSTGLTLDALMVINDLSAGDYTVALTQYNNVIVGFGLSDGFLHAGDPTFTVRLDGNPSCSNGQFCSYGQNNNDPVNRTNLWALDILNVTSVPVPAAVWLFGSGLLGLVALARRKRI